MSVIETVRIDSSDIDEHAEAIAPWCVRLTQVTPGGFHGRLHAVRTEGLIVYRERWNRGVSVIGESPPGYAMVGMPAADSFHVFWSGRDLSERLVAFSPPSGEVEFSLPGRADHVVALVRSDLMARFVGDAEVADIRLERHWNCFREAGQALRDILTAIIARYGSQTDPVTDPRATEALESEVLTALAGCAQWGPGPGDDRTRRKEALRCAVAHAKSRIEPLSVPELAEVAGVSQRTLEYAFREGMGITPIQFLRRCRLNGAHRQLRSAAPDETTVTAVGLEWGFNDLGRFAAEHRSMFGAHPSQTLAERRSPPRRLHP